MLYALVVLIVVYCACAVGLLTRRNWREGRLRRVVLAGLTAFILGAAVLEDTNDVLLCITPSSINLCIMFEMILSRLKMSE